MSKDYSGKIIAIVARAPRTKHHALTLDDERVNIWTIAACAEMDELKGKRLDVVLEIHRPDWLSDRKYIEPLDAWLKQEHAFPLYMQDAYPQYPASVRYPYEMVERMFPVMRGEKINKFFTSSLDYLLALAISCSPDEIWLIGFDMGTETEYRYQREGASFWAGVAAGAGIRLWIPEEAAFLYSRRYGYDFAQAIREERLRELHEELTREKAEADAERHRLQKLAMEDKEYIESYWSAEWIFHKAYGAHNVIEQVLKDFVVGDDPVLTRQRLERLHTTLLIQRDEALARVNYWSGVMTDRQTNGATVEDVRQAAGQHDQVKAQFYGLDGANQVLRQLIAEIDGQEYQNLEMLYTLVRNNVAENNIV